MQFIDSKIQQQSNPIGILSLIAHFLEEQGYEAQPIFEQFAIKPEDLKHNLMPVSLHVQGSIFKAVEELTGCDHLGLLIGKNAQLSNIGPLRFLVLNAATLRDAMQSLFQFGSMWYRGQQLDLQENQGYARICMQIEGDIPAKGQYQTAYLMSMVSIIELILAKPWRPSLVHIAEPKPKSAYLYEKFFGCPVLFGQTRHEILFPQEQLDQKRIGYDHQLDQFLRQHLTELQKQQEVDIQTQVTRIIEELLPHRLCTIERVAEYFAIHRNTLYRHLHSAGTTFEALLEQTRKDKVMQLLPNKKLMLIDVANQLGYEDQANFSRAFKRWYGLPPARWRKTM